MLNDIQAIVLAAGKSTSFNTHKTKLAEKICGQEIILYSTKLLEALKIPTTVVIGYQKDILKAVINAAHQEHVAYITQEEQNGDAHAIQSARSIVNAEHILIMHGTIPLIKQETIEKLYETHRASHAAVTSVTAHHEDGNCTYNHEEKESINNICCTNNGIYIVTHSFLISFLDNIQSNSSPTEWFLHDIIPFALAHHAPIATVTVPYDQLRKVRTLQDLWAIEHIKRSELIQYWMRNGVRFLAAQTVHIDIDVHIGANSVIGSGVHLLRASKVGAHAYIHPFSLIEHASLEEGVEIYSHSIIRDSHIGSRAKIGPFAHISEKSIVEEDAIIGNFVEVKRSRFGKKSKAKHLAYLGDAIIGTSVNIGAGTITCNHDGAQKHATTIKDGAYIGSNNTLVAPLTIEENAFTAAGSTITLTVPQDALGIGRARQINKEGYAKKLRAKKTNQEQPFIGAVKTNNDNVSEGQ